MLVLIVDTETTGTDTSNDSVIEIAAALVDTTMQIVIGVYSALIWAKHNPPDAYRVNKIPQSALELDIAKNPDLSPIIKMANIAEIIIAHNADFDRPMTNRLFESLGLEILAKPWVCSVKDISFPLDIHGAHPSRTAKGCRKLTHLAADYGISALGAHRAMADVMILSQLILLVDANGQENLRGMAERSFKPKKLYNAIVKKPWEDESKEVNLAKEAGFRFNPLNKKWQKELTFDEIESFPFDVEVS